MSDGTLPGPRDWIGAAPFPWPAVSAIGVGDIFHACYFLVSVQTLRTKADKPYLRLQLQDVHGALEGRVWEMAEQIAASLRDGIYVGVRGRVEVFNGERQLKVEEVAQISVGLDDLEHFMPRSPRDPEIMDRELAEWIASVDDAPLRELLEHMLGAGTDIGSGFRLAPAAKFNHHAYLGGLIEHTLSIVSVCDMLARHYQPHIDRDLLIAGALLHDVGKVREIGARAGFPYTDEGKLLGHIVLGMQMIADAAADVPALSSQRLTLLQHLVASHQGRYEWQSPREPRTLEAY
ncbi:MAG: 3'-5' exoribonuclease YhaM family protein, partial [Longimicrobiales bacterium]